jgi:phosphoglycolate phosphatase-like HAD superfamily hydrolase
MPANHLPFPFVLSVTSSSATSEVASNNQPSQDSSTANENDPIKAILFDIDGTLANSWKLGYDATQVVLQRNNISPITVETYHDGTRYSTPERLARHAGYAPSHQDFERIGNQLGKEFDDFYVSLVSLETALFYPGILKMLQQIPSHVKLGALTNAAVKYADAVLKCNCPVYTNKSVNDSEEVSSSAIFSRFGSIRGADNVPKPKPAPDGLWDVCKDLEVDPKRCIYVGDSPTDGMAAKSAGMKAVGVTWGSHKLATMQASFDHICESVDELEQFLLQQLQ